MEITEISKFFFATITAISTIAVTFYNIGQSQKTRVEILERFEHAVESKRKHSVSELFRILHGLRMNYTDIVTLIEDDECSKIIYALKKTPGLVCYENGMFQYNHQSSSKLWNLFGTFIPKMIAGITGSILISMVFLATFTAGVQSLTAWVMVVGISIVFGATIKQIQYNNLVDKLVNNKT
jgi:hypothetical protein